MQAVVPFASLEELEDQVHARELRQAKRRAHSRAERRVKRQNPWGCVIGNTCAPGVDTGAFHRALFGRMEARHAASL